jgi:hypothetical protein
MHAMPHVTVYFHDAIKLIDVMRAAEHIGCTLEGDARGGALLVVPKKTEHGPIEQTLLKQLGFAVANGAEFRHCNYCEKQFAVGVKGAGRIDKRYCSHSCRVMASRARKLATKAE